MNPELSLPRHSSRLRQRMQILAQPLLADETEDSLEIVVFSLGYAIKKSEVENYDDVPSLGADSGYYAFETAQVREVFSIADASQIAMLPGTPTWVRGILNVRGRILAVLDLQQLFGLPQQEAVTDAPVLILRGEVLAEAALKDENESTLEVGDVALATNGVAGVRLLPRAKLETGHALEGTSGARYLRGLTQEGIALLDAALLLSDVQLVVQAE